jgi:hypothetical protein
MKVFAILLALMPVATAKCWSAESCPSQITTCGCVIDAPGEYRLAGPLTQSIIGATCLEVDATKVLLELGGNSIIGAFTQPSTATTALRMPPHRGCNATDAFEPGEPDIGIRLAARAENSVLVGGEAIISGFADCGVQIESAGAIVSGLKADGNGFGIELNHAHGVQLVAVEASNNLANGLSLTGASANQIDDLIADNNGDDGVMIYGQSSENRLSGFQTNSNGNGIEVTPYFCGSSASRLIGCLPHGGHGNVLIGGEANGNLGYGISMYEPGSSAIIDNTATMNGTFDLIDEASDCAHNLWFGNTFATSSPSACIH